MQEYTYKKITPCDVCSQVLREPTDVDQIYQVLKQAGEISSGKIVADPSKGPGATGTAGPVAAVSNPPLDIPVVKVPEYPDRAPWRGPVKSQGPNYPHQKQGLTAPVATDMSCSDMRVPTNPSTHQPAAIDSGARRRLFAGFRPMSGFGILRLRSAQHRSISLPESN
uniref:Zasp-like motif domain-containing protein n=1 Tax=Anopheles culicifacies TaxID=139723 RepID=A0A182M4N6_9DIPT